MERAGERRRAVERDVGKGVGALGGGDGGVCGIPWGGC